MPHQVVSVAGNQVTGYTLAPIEGEAGRWGLTFSTLEAGPVVTIIMRTEQLADAVRMVLGVLLPTSE